MTFDPLTFLFVVWYGYLVVVLLVGLDCISHRPQFKGPRDEQGAERF